uniref:Longin domain-containing protein n=1 Tax=Macrostomum lignano TaxID=282301 RepID=A0A1I8FY50_9PLAT
MILLTMIARVSDGLPLAASIHNEETAPNMPEYQSKAKKLFRRLNSTSPSRCSLESGAYTFQSTRESATWPLPVAISPNAWPSPTWTISVANSPTNSTPSGWTRWPGPTIS